MENNAPVDEKYLVETITTWQPLSTDVLNADGAKQISGNMVGLFSLLIEWDSKAND
jgi:hypothetical protein